MNIDQILARLKLSKLEGDKRMKQGGINKAENWCAHGADYREIKRLATFRQCLGDEWSETVNEEIGYIAIAARATASGADCGYQQAELFWGSVDAIEEEYSDIMFLEGFIEGCEVFWKKYGDKI